MLRLDVSELPYSVPADNPWAEVWATGFRNSDTFVECTTMRSAPSTAADGTAPAQ